MEMFKKKNNKIKYQLNYKYINKPINSKKLVSFILILLISSTVQILPNLRILTSITEIIITIQGTGDQKILGDSAFVPLPDEILVNRDSNTEIGKIVNILDNSKKNITMRRNNISTNFANIFKDLKNITDIYFSNIDTSQITDMSYIYLVVLQ